MDEDRLRKMERVTKLSVVLFNNPLRYSASDLARKFETTVRTVYRDIRMLERLEFVPYNEKGKWAINKSSYLPSVRLTVPEALTFFLAARLMLSYSYRYDPVVESAFIKLNSVVPPALKEQIQQTMDWMGKLPKNEKYLRNLTKLAEAWISRRRIKISYRALEKEEAKDHLIEPYFIQPASTGRSSYVIARSDLAAKLLIFKIERIENIQETSETYTIPADFDANEYLSAAWDISVEGDVKTVKLKFKPVVARIIQESMWHPSQVLETRKDGSVLMTLNVMDTMEFFRWLLRWGDDVEVLEPPEIRDEVIETAKAMRKVYGKKGKK
jgi:predicted DNA-binding transcriptional regulator YafY